MNLENLPKNYMGGMNAASGEIIGFDLHLTRITTDESLAIANITGVCDLYVDPPTINLTNTFGARLNTKDRSIQIDSDSSLFHIRANLSDDMQTIAGKVDISNFHLLDVKGSFRNERIVLEAYDKEADD